MSFSSRRLFENEECWLKYCTPVKSECLKRLIFIMPIDIIYKLLTNLPHYFPLRLAVCMYAWSYYTQQAINIAAFPITLHTFSVQVCMKGRHYTQVETAWTVTSIWVIRLTQATRRNMGKVHNTSY